MIDKKFIMQRILDYIRLYNMKYNESPSVRKIAEIVDISKSSVQNYIVEMNEKGIVSYENGVISVDLPDGFSAAEHVRIPVVGNINCGNPETEIQEITEYISVPLSFSGKNCYGLRATGDSMEDAGIYEGDIVVIERTANCKPGDIIVALDDNKQNTLKAFGGIHNGKAVLEYMNERLYPGKYIEVPELSVQGIARTIIKKMRRKENLIFQ